MTLTKVAPRPPLSPAEARGTEITLSDPGDQWNPTMRLDLCVDEHDQPQLRQVILKTQPPPGPVGDSPPSYLVIVPHPRSIVQHLAESVFGDTAGLEVFLPFGWGDAWKLVGPPA